jgi:glyoxylase-like metal-dependent hydrolase (beta-lactamase superfamily II)
MTMARPRHVARAVELFPARTPTLPPATHTNSYAVGDREVLLVEPATPYDDERVEWLAWARGLVSQGRKLVGIALTHHHLDHVGGAEVFARELGLPLWAHRATAERLPELRFDRLLEDGEEIVLDGEVPSRWRVLHTPGHAAGHVCLFDERARVAIVGDMVASVGTILIAPGEGDMIEYLVQLDRLAGLHADAALPAHGDPIAEGSGPSGASPTQLFRFYVAHRLAREAKVAAALPAPGSAGSTLEQLLPVVYADTSPAVWPLALLSLEAHLLKLERDGRATRSGAGWVSAARSAG